MKGCFLVSQRGREAWKNEFHFAPFDYGPFDRGVYRARDALVAQRLLREDTSARYPTYELTDEGRERMDEIEEQIGPENTAWLGRVGKYVTSRSFSTLLNEIYRAYPQFAVRSVMR
jgi:uncharacterized protein